MRPVYGKLALTGIVGIGIGLFGGQATITGMAPAASAATIGGVDDAIGEGDRTASRETPERLPDYGRVADDCDSCSDYDLGYRFAAARGVRESAECMDFSWSYQRGCIARLREE